MSALSIFKLQSPLCLSPCHSYFPFWNLIGYPFFCQLQMELGFLSKIRQRKITSSPGLTSKVSGSWSKVCRALVLGTSKRQKKIREPARCIVATLFYWNKKWCYSYYHCSCYISTPPRKFWSERTSDHRVETLTTEALFNESRRIFRCNLILPTSRGL